MIRRIKQECHARDGILTTAATDLSWKCQVKEYPLLIKASNCTSVLHIYINNLLLSAIQTPTNMGSLLSCSPLPTKILSAFADYATPYTISHSLNTFTSNIKNKKVKKSSLRVQMVCSETPKTHLMKQCIHVNGNHAICVSRNRLLVCWC